MKIYVDGSGSNGSAYGRYCFWIKDINIARIFKKKGITSNQAEYLSVLAALQSNFIKPEEDIIIYSDSQIVVKQFNKQWHIRNDKLRKLFIKTLDLMHMRGLKVKFKWVSRKKNMAGKILG